MYGVVLTVHNRAASLNSTLPSLLTTVAGSWELAVVLDDCTDDSRAVLLELLPRARPSCAGPMGWSGSLQRIVIYETVATPLFETASENLGMRLLDPSLAYLLVQTDAYLGEVGWNLVLASAMAADKRVVAVSGRCVMPGQRSHGAWCAGTRRRRRSSVSMSKQVTALMGIAVRGPLLMRASAARSIGFFDDSCHFLGGDDSEFGLRAYGRHGWLGAYAYVDVHQLPSLHSAGRRRKRDAQAHRVEGAPPDAWRRDGLPSQPHITNDTSRCLFWGRPRLAAEVERRNFVSRPADERDPFQLDLGWLRRAFATVESDGCGGNVPAWLVDLLEG